MKQRLSLLLTCFLACLVLAGCKSNPSPPAATETPAGKSSPTTALASPSPNTTVEPLNFKSELLQEIKHGGFYDQYLMFSPDGRYLASWLPEKLAVFEVATGKSAGEIPEGRLPLAFSEDGTVFYTVGTKGLESWNCPGMKLKETIEKPEGESADGAWTFIEWANGLKSLAGNRGRLANFPIQSMDYPVSAYNAAHTPEGALVAYSLGSKIAVTAPSDEKPWESETLGRSITSVVLSDDGSTAVAGGMSGSLSVIDVKARKTLSSERVPGEIRCLALAGDGRTLAFGCGDGMQGAGLIDIQTMTPLALLAPENSNVWAVALTKDSKTLAVGSDDGIIRLFKLY
jgi:WD40 repeat protein